MHTHKIWKHTYSCIHAQIHISTFRTFIVWYGYVVLCSVCLLFTSPLIAMSQLAGCFDVLNVAILSLRAAIAY